HPVRMPDVGDRGPGRVIWWLWEPVDSGDGIPADVVDRWDSIGDATAAPQDRGGRPRPDPGECLELGERLGLGQHPQPFGVEDAVDGCPGQVMQAGDLDLRESRDGWHLEQALWPRERPDRPATDLDRVAV